MLLQTFSLDLLMMMIILFQLRIDSLMNICLPSPLMFLGMQILPITRLQVSFQVIFIQENDDRSSNEVLGIPGYKVFSYSQKWI